MEKIKSHQATIDCLNGPITLLPASLDGTGSNSDEFNLFQQACTQQAIDHLEQALKLSK